jgi:branched-chain amino acid transport system substrate-binding protein
MRSARFIPLLFGFQLFMAGFAATAVAESVKLGVLTDLSSVYSDSSGNGAIYATEMAIADLKPELEAAGMEVTVVSADHHGKPDIGASLAR